MSNFDEALERFHQVELEYGVGLANHGPMGAEALESLGHHALIPAFVGLYVPRLPVFSPGKALPEDARSGALGAIERGSDWVATFEAELASGDWRDVLAEVVPDLLPGMFASAGHGLLRTVHGIRALEREDTPLRRRELARGLAHWAARYQELPGKIAPGGKGVLVARSLAAWPLLEDPDAREGLFSECEGKLTGFSAFREAFEGLAIPAPGEVDGFLDAVCDWAAAQYVGHPGARLAYVHVLTIPSGVRSLVPYLSEDAASAAGGYALQAAAALHSVYGRTETVPEDDEEVLRVMHDWDELRYHAACSIQEHSIKMVDACWREDQRRPNPLFRRAAADAALKIDARGQVSVC